MWRRILRGLGPSTCNVYLFDAVNPDYLALDAPFTGNVKLILAATSETGINAQILPGLQGVFTPSLDPVNSPEWNQYEADVTSLIEIVSATFTGVVKFALDDIWYTIDMGAISTVSGTGVPWLNQLVWG